MESPTGHQARWSLWAASRRVRGWLGSLVWKVARFRSAAELRSLVEHAGISVRAVRGAVYYPPVSRAARALASLDPWLGRLTTIGAAFVAVAGTKPHLEGALANTRR